MHVPFELGSGVCIGKESLRELFHALRANVGQTILLLVIMEKLPGWVSISIGLIDVKIVGVHVDRQHGLLIEVNHHVGWVLLGISGYTATNVGKHDWSSGVGHALHDFEILSVGMTVHSEANSVLESFHECTIASSKLMLALVGRVMRDQKCKSSLGLNFHELLLEPGVHIAWVFALTPSIPVQTVASLSVVCDNTRSLGHCLSICECNRHAIESVLTELLIGLWGHPLLPVTLEIVDFIVDSWRSE